MAQTPGHIKVWIVTALNAGDISGVRGVVNSLDDAMLLAEHDACKAFDNPRAELVWQELDRTNYTDAEWQPDMLESHSGCLGGKLRLFDAEWLCECWQVNVQVGR